jgi:hypothetical protein
MLIIFLTKITMTNVAGSYGIIQQKKYRKIETTNVYGTRGSRKNMVCRTGSGAGNISIKRIRMGELLRLKPSPEMRASLIQEHADLIDKVGEIQDRARLAVEQAEVDAAPYMQRAEEIEAFLYGDSEKTGS